MENEELLKKWLDNSLSKEDRAIFEQTDDYRFVQRLSNALRQFKSPRYNQLEELEKFNYKKNLLSSESERSWYFWLKAAAVVIIMFGLFWYFYPVQHQSREYIAKNQLLVTLPDSSFAKLNKGSKLTFDPSKWNGVRRAYLDGEGYFVAKPGETFDIISKTGKVSVIGTSFNIIDRENFFEVTCYRGRVKVATKQGSVVLEANQSYRVVDNSGEFLNVKLSRVPNWINGESSFDNVPLGLVLKELERQYLVTVDTGIVNTNVRFSGKFTHSDLNLALKSITLPMNIGFEVVDSQVRLVSDKK